ncbi:MAG: ATP-dependent DNA helicase [Endomicrobiia bacterium]
MNSPKILSSSKNSSENAITQIFSSLLKEIILDFEFREQQVIMAKKIYHSFLNDKKIIVEAPTGIGKSLSYLVASLVYLKENNDNVRIIVSTYTKTLQQQLLKKDFPLLNKISQKLYNYEIKYMCFYGSENYICLNKYFEFKKGLLTTDELINLAKVEEWLNYTDTGCIDELDIDLNFWQEINREVDLCRSRHCKFYDQCFYYKNIKKMKKMDFVVVNHHLFFANILYSGKLIPNNDKDTQDIIIFDEAHNLGDVILQWLGFEVSNTQIKFLCNQIYNPKKQRGLLTKLKSLPEEIIKNIQSSLANLVACSGQFFTDLNLKVPNNKKEIRIFMPNIVDDVLTSALGELLNVLRSARNSVSTDEEFFRINVFIKRILSFISIISLWLKCEDLKNYIYWIEKEETKRKNLKITLRITPLEVANEMQTKVYSLYKKIVFTSATVAVYNNFDFFKKSVGLLPVIIPESNLVDELILDFPFDFENNVVLYLPENIPDPKEEYEEYKILINKIIKELINLTSGNTFVLFTSFELMNWVYENIDSKFKILIQTEGKYKLIEKYKSTENSVLFGVDTFWQGVDIPGEKLISIIIPKLPFDVPEHPLVEAKVEKIKLEGKDPFKEYLLPNAIIKLKQGFGRLVRRKTDWGIISILDPRLKTRWYGKYFLKSLPKCMITTNFSLLKEFFKKRKNI